MTTTIRFTNDHERLVWTNTVSQPGFSVETAIARADAFVLAMREREKAPPVERESDDLDYGST